MNARIIRGLAAVRPMRRAVVTIGVFDGVHSAHQHVIRSTAQLARRLNGTSVVITFDPDPQTVLAPQQAHPALMTLEARLDRMGQLGADSIIVIPFTARFARISARRFIKQILLRRLRAVALVVGEDFTFGTQRRGGMTLLRRLGSHYGMQVLAIRKRRQGGKPVSSSRIRRLIAAGRLAQAARLLGRPPELYGVVVRGAGRGRWLGVPTANLQLASSALPPQGVYVVRLRDLDRGRTWRGVMNLGVRPTFGTGPLVCEVHLLDFSGMLLGRRVVISLFARLRNERCFPTPNALIRQVRLDIARARRVLSHHA